MRKTADFCQCNVGNAFPAHPPDRKPGRGRSSRSMSLMPCHGLLSGRSACCRHRGSLWAQRRKWLAAFWLGGCAADRICRLFFGGGGVGKRITSITWGENRCQPSDKAHEKCKVLTLPRPYLQLTLPLSVADCKYLLPSRLIQGMVEGAVRFFSPLL